MKGVTLNKKKGNQHFITETFLTFNPRKRFFTDVLQTGCFND